MNLAQDLRGFGPIGLLAILSVLAGAAISPLVAAILILIWANLSQTAPAELGLTRPRRWAGSMAVGIILGIAFELTMKAIVMPLLGAPPLNSHYHYLAGNAAALPGLVATVLVVAGFGEEVFFRGYLFERAGKLIGRGTLAVAGTVVASATLFALAHYPDQGLPGVEQAAVTGLVFGGVFAWRRELWGIMAAHAAFDLAAVALIYWNWEDRVAHVFLR